MRRIPSRRRTARVAEQSRVRWTGRVRTRL